MNVPSNKYGSKKKKKNNKLDSKVVFNLNFLRGVYTDFVTKNWHRNRVIYFKNISLLFI